MQKHNCENLQDLTFTTQKYEYDYIFDPDLENII